MSDLLDEISEDLKSENYNKIISATVRVFLILVAVILAGVAIYSWQSNTSDKLQKQLSISYNQGLKALEANQLDESIDHFDQVIKSSHQQYAALAYLNKAFILIKQQKHQEAQETLMKLSEQKHFDLAFRELADIIYLSNQLNTQTITSEQNQILDRLTKENKPWQSMALQLQALIELKQGNSDNAINSLNQIMQSPVASKASKDIALSILSSINKSK